MDSASYRKTFIGRAFVGSDQENVGALRATPLRINMMK